MVPWTGIAQIDIGTSNPIFGLSQLMNRSLLLKLSRG